MAPEFFSDVAVLIDSALVELVDSAKLRIVDQTHLTLLRAVL